MATINYKTYILDINILNNDNPLEIIYAPIIENKQLTFRFFNTFVLGVVFNEYTYILTPDILELDITNDYGFLFNTDINRVLYYARTDEEATVTAVRQKV